MKIDHSMRLFFGVVATLMWLGILMTGLSHVHWLLYVPTVFFTVAAALGICPGIWISKMVTGKNGDDQ